jgi:hypothetical protein
LGIKTYVAPRIYSSHLVVNGIAHEHYDRASVQTEALQVNGTTGKTLR